MIFDPDHMIPNPLEYQAVSCKDLQWLISLKYGMPEGKAPMHQFGWLREALLTKIAGYPIMVDHVFSVTLKTGRGDLHIGQKDWLVHCPDGSLTVMSNDMIMFLFGHPDGK